MNPQSPNPDRRFPRETRIRLRNEFAGIYAARRHASDKRLTVYVRENGLGFARLGLSVGRKVGGAVQRNRIKRRIREAFRAHKSELPIGYDILCVVRSAAPATPTEYADSLRQLVQKAMAREVRKQDPR